MQIDPEILISVLLGEASEEDVRRLEVWRAMSPENDREYRRIARLWSIAGRVERGQARMPPPARVIRQKAELRSSPTTRPTETERDAGKTPPLPAASTPSTRSTGSRPSAVLSLAAALVIGLGMGTWIPSGGTETVEPEILVTGADDVATLTLQDNSVVHLAPNSRLVFSRGADAREVSLTGRAYFAVAEDPQRPFRVRLPDGEVEVLGTRFDVEGRNGRTQVTVVDGNVRMESRGARLNVGANQVARISDGGVPEVESVENVYEVIDWLGQFLAFESTPMEEVAVELERRFGIRVQIADAELRRRTVTGWFSDQSAEAMISAICTVIEARCSTLNGRVRMEVSDRGGLLETDERTVGNHPSRHGDDEWAVG